jgi:hypothetical protein
MKHFIAVLTLAFATFAVQAAEPAKAPDTKKAENTNCVKKDKAGKCPALPNSPKPTPKKKAETK